MKQRNLCKSFLVLMLLLLMLPVSSHAESNESAGKDILMGIYEVPRVHKLARDNYREFDRWYVYDQGITSTWSYLSNPYFIKSIARGMTYEKTQTISTTIEGTLSSSIPEGAIPSIKSAFGLSGSASGSRTITEKITLSGPDNGYSSRSFYYKNGRHTHKVRIVQEFCTNWDGVIWTKEYIGTVGRPAVYTYSVDYK